jgi:hypothetical protein
MSTRVLLTAVLDKLPTRLTSKAGKTYLRASVRDGNGPDAKWWTLFVFSVTAIEALEGLALGESFAASGTFEASIWAPEGREPRVNLTLTADAILSARKPKAKRDDKHRQPSARDSLSREPSARETAAKSWASPNPGADFDDQIPF